MKQKEIIKNKKGFTLVEVIVVCVILGILMSIAAGGLYAYQKIAAFRKNNEYAQTIFAAAQSSFAQAKAGGQLEELSVQMEKEYSGNQLDLSLIKGGAKAQMKESKDSRLYYFIYKKDRQAFDPALAAEEKSAEQIVYEMIEPYVYDAEVMDATFCVEFDPADGTVWAVLYNDTASDFIYEGEATKEKNNIADRSTAVRKELLLGYYGADMLSDKAPGSQTKNLIQNMQLVNGETLELQWNMFPQYDAQSYAFSVRLYNPETKKIEAAIKINQGTIAKWEANTPWNDNTYNIACDVTLYDYDEAGKKTAKPSVKMKFDAYVQNTGAGTNMKMKYHLILDAVDLQAARLQNNQAGNEEPDYTQTFSIKRMELATSGLYIRMKAKNEKYQSSSWKQTKMESSLFGSETVKEETKSITTTTCEIKNARHLFNIRFTEGTKEQENKIAGAAKQDNYVYRQSADIAWDSEAAKKAGILQNMHVFDGQKSVKPQKNDAAGAKERYQYKAFPAIEALHTGNTYNAYREKENYSITGIVLYEENNAAGQFVPLGLFGTNEGSMQKMNLKAATVYGMKYTGTVCGVNYGLLSEITVDDASVVTGTDYVGGITGSDITGKPVEIPGAEDKPIYQFERERTYKNLSNSADVFGKNYVGGIVGYIHGIYGTQQTTLSIAECKNLGMVQGTDINGICIGGIAGYNKRTTLENCKSEMQLSDKQKAQLKADADGDTLKGNFVGGIVGFNEGGSFEQCISGSEGLEDFVVGRTYVGGIVGFHTDEAKKDVTVSSGLSAGSKEQLSKNDSNVVGRQYVGGVASVVGSLTGNLQGLFRLDGSTIIGAITVQKKVTVSESGTGGLIGWTNTGVAAATFAYAGGITGYNDGILIDCTTQVNMEQDGLEGVTDFIREFTVDQEKGDYIGAVAGYNNNDILLRNAKTVSGITVGNDYVGGVVGYNDVDGSTDAFYRVAEQYIAGNEFVGGYVGLNRCTDLRYVDQKGAVRKPISRKIEGRLFVGGVIGGNIISGNMTSEYAIEAPECTISGTAFVGGFAGYNNIVNAGDANESVGRMSAIDPAELEWTALRAKVREEDGLPIQGASITIAGPKENAPSRYQLLQGDIYVGGILGYNAENAVVSISNISNDTPIRADGYITQDNANYSFAGGIIGDVTPAMAITNCINKASDRMNVPEEVYLGGIAERNRGKIKECKTFKMPYTEHSRVGGIAGKNEGTIANSHATAVIQGQTVVGGIAAQNSGTIENCTTDAKAKVLGTENVGGIAGYLTGGSVLKCINRVDISGKKSIGGIAGQMASGDVETKVADCTNQGVIYGGSGVGGITGYASGIGSIGNCVNIGNIQGEETGSRAGILGEAQEGAVTIERCRNYGLPILVEIGENNFSGIIGGNSQNATLSGCFGVSDCTYPITNADVNVTDKGNYYFTDQKQPENEKPSISITDGLEGGTPVKPEGVHGIDRLLDGNLKTDCKYKSDASAITLDFKAGRDIETLTLYWGGNTNKRYSYTIWYKAMDAAGWQQIDFKITNGNEIQTHDLKGAGKISGIQIQIQAMENSGQVQLYEIEFDGQPNKTKNAFTLLEENGLSAQERAGSGDKGLGTPLYVSDAGGGTFDVDNDAENAHIKGLRANPTDLAFNMDYSTVVIGSESQNLRYAMYRTIDDQLVVFSNPETDNPVEPEKPGEELPPEQPIEKTAFTQPGAPEVTLVDTSGDSYLYNVKWQGLSSEAELADLAGYTVMVLKDGEEEPVMQEVSKDQTAVEMDLEAFAGSKVSVLVQANAKNDAMQFTDSEAGKPYQLTVPNRNETPDASKLTVDKDYDSPELTKEEFEQTGITIQLTEAGKPANGIYGLRGAIYKDAAQTELLEELEGIEMEGNGSEGIRHLTGLSGDYAGSHLVLEVQRKSADQMNSAWSRKMLFRLPKIKLEAPTMTEAQVVKEYKELQSTEVDGVSVEREADIWVEQNALAWNESLYAGSYLIDLSAFSYQKSAEQFQLRITKNTNGESEPFTITKLTDRTDLAGKPIWDVMGGVITDYPDENDQSNTRVYAYEFQYDRVQAGTVTTEDGSGFGYSIPLKGYLECLEYTKPNTDTVYSFRLVLPDVTTEAGILSVHGTDFKDYLFTGAAAIMAEPEDAERYGKSDVMKWWREKDPQGNWITKIE